MARKFLLVEGTDDEHVLKHICGNCGGPRIDEVKPHGGIDKLMGSIPVFLKACQDGDIVGVIIDADTDLVARWQSIRHSLNGIGYTAVPVTPTADGTIIDPPAGVLLPRVGVWIMPDNRTNGILEDFLRFLIPPTGAPLFTHVTNSVATIPAGERRFGTLAEPKAHIHTWLAWQEEPGKPMGTSITARYFDATVPQVAVLVSWLNRLFL